MIFPQELIIIIASMSHPLTRVRLSMTCPHFHRACNIFWLSDKPENTLDFNRIDPFNIDLDCLYDEDKESYDIVRHKIDIKVLDICRNSSYMIIIHKGCMHVNYRYVSERLTQEQRIRVLNNIKNVQGDSFETQIGINTFCIELVCAMPKDIIKTCFEDKLWYQCVLAASDLPDELIEDIQRRRRCHSSMGKYAARSSLDTIDKILRFTNDKEHIIDAYLKTQDRPDIREYLERVWYVRSRRHRVYILDINDIDSAIDMFAGGSLSMDDLELVANNTRHKPIPLRWHSSNPKCLERFDELFCTDLYKNELYKHFELAIFPSSLLNEMTTQQLKALNVKSSVMKSAVAARLCSKHINLGSYIDLLLHPVSAMHDVFMLGHAGVIEFLTQNADIKPDDCISLLTWFMQTHKDRGFKKLYDWCMDREGFSSMIGDSIHEYKRSCL